MQKRKPKLITPAEYARRRKLNPSTVSRQVAEGVIPLRGGKINPVEADRARANNLDTARRRAKAGEEPIDTDPTLLESRRRKEAALARMRELEVGKLEGSLVDVQEEQRTWAVVAQTVRDGLLSLPERIAPELAALTDVRAVRDRLGTEVRQVLTELPAKINSALQQPA